MFKPAGTLTNQKPARESGPVVTLTPTKGIIRVNTLAARVLGLTDGDYIAVEGGADENGNVVNALFKGHPSDEEAGTNQLGSKLAFPSGRNAGNLQFSSANAWLELGGEKGESRFFTVAEEPTEVEGIEYFLLTPREDDGDESVEEAEEQIED